MSLVVLLLAVGLFFVALPAVASVGVWAAYVAIVCAAVAVLLSLTGNDRRVG